VGSRAGGTGAQDGGEQRERERGGWSETEGACQQKRSSQRFLCSSSTECGRTASCFVHVRVCASRKWCGDGAYSKYAESDAQRWGSHAGLSPSGVLGSRDCGSRRRLTGKYVDMRGGTFLAHFRRYLVSWLLLIHADGACTAPRGSRFQRFACGMFPWAWRRPIQQCDAFLR
jgi:hypothetical protein